MTGEIALGNLKRRDIVLRALRRLPQATVASHEEVLRLVEYQPLYGLGIGYVDAHLLAAVRLTTGAKLWTWEHRLRTVATQVSNSVRDSIGMKEEKKNKEKGGQREANRPEVRPAMAFDLCVAG